MEKNKRMQFYGGTLGACAPLLVFMCLMIVIAAMKKVSLVLFCMAGFAGLCVAFLLAKNKKEFEQAVVDGLKNDTLCVIIFAFLLAGILSQELRQSGLIQGLTWLVMKLGLLLVAFANVGTQGTGSYVNCMIVKSGMPKVSYKVLVLIAMVYVSALTVWGGVEEHFGAFISIAAFIQAPIIGMIVVDYLVVKKRKLSLKAAYFIEGHDAYRFTGGFNLVGIGCVILSCLITILFVYNPLTGSIQSPLFLIFTGSGFDAICGGLLYWLASLTPLKKYMLRDRDDLEIV